MPGFTVRSTSGAQANLSLISLPDGTAAIAYVLVDGNGVPYSLANVLRTGPAIVPATFTDRSGTIAVANATTLDIPPDPNRVGGSFRAGAANTGVITVAIKNAAGLLHSEVLQPGDGFGLTVNGYVIQDEIGISGTAAGDTFTGVTFVGPA